MCTLKINVLFSYSFVGKVNEIKLKLVMEYKNYVINLQHTLTRPELNYYHSPLILLPIRPVNAPKKQIQKMLIYSMKCNSPGSLILKTCTVESTAATI